MNTYPVTTVLGTFEVHFVNATNACVWTPNGASVTVGKGTYTANVGFTRDDGGTWNQVLVGQSAPLIKRAFPDLRAVPLTVETKILDITGVALRAVLEDDPGAPVRAELDYAERAVQSAKQDAVKAHDAAVTADEKLAQASRRLRAAVQAAAAQAQPVA